MKYAIELRISLGQEQKFYASYLNTDEETGNLIESEGVSLQIVKQYLNKKGDSRELHYLAKHKKINNRYFLLNPFDTLTTADENDYSFYAYAPTQYNSDLKNKVITPILDNSEWDKLNIISCESGRQIAWTAITNKWNFTDTLGLPFAIGMLGCVLRYTHAYLSFEKKYNRKPNLKELDSIRSDCAAFTAKMVIGMGGWNLGYFIGQSLLTFYAITPLTWLVSLTLAFCAGFTQAIGVVLIQIDNEKNNYNEIRSSSLDYAKLFFSTMISGAAWQEINNYFPVPWVAGLVTFVTLGAIKTLPELATSAAKNCCASSFFAKPAARDYDASAAGLGLPFASGSRAP